MLDADAHQEIQGEAAKVKTEKEAQSESNPGLLEGPPRDCE